MNQSVYVYDPTASDELSKVRGIGRYLHILKENFDKTWIFTDSIKRISADSAFINPFFNFLKPPLLMRRIAKKQIAVIHDLIPLKYPKRFPVGLKGKLNIFLNQLSLNNYDIIITDSEASKKDIVKILGIDEKRIKIIYPCLPKIFTEKVQNSKPPNRRSKFKIHPSIITQDNPERSRMGQISNSFCLYVGDATWNKNIVNLAKAIKILNVTCVFVGKVFEKFSNFKFQISNLENPWQQELRDFINETKNDQRFIFKGFVPDNELINLYQQAKVNILPSRDEGFGFSYLEAASQHCPSVLSDIPVLHEISGEQGMFADPLDNHNLANTIGEIYFNSETRKKWGEKAYQRSLYFSAKELTKKFQNITDNL